MKSPNTYMKRALKLAKKAGDLGEIPIGAVIVLNDEIISEAYNQRNAKKDATAHAEVLAIKKACKKLLNPLVPVHFKYSSSLNPLIEILTKSMPLFCKSSTCSLSE